MKGKDITKLAVWPKLEALNFRPIRFRGAMGFYEIGAAMIMDGRELIVIEPLNYRLRPNWWVRPGLGASWRPQPSAPLSRRDTAGHVAYEGPTRYVPTDTPFGADVHGRGILREVSRLVGELAA